MTKYKSYFPIDDLVILLIALPYVYYFTHPLIDADLPWHLAGGLWTLENFSVPKIDFLGPIDTEWIAYSWLPEVLMALAFKIASFQGLQLFQTLLFAAVILSAAWLVKVSRVDDSARSQIASWITLAIVLYPMAALWELRPQVFSQFFFCLLIGLIIKKGPRTLWLYPLLIVWANTHFYWLLVPGVYFMCSVANKEITFKKLFHHSLITAGMLLLGLVNPYGIGLYEAMYGHIAEIEGFERYVTEFMPLTIERGIIFWILSGIAVSGAVFSRSFCQLRGFGLFLLFAIIGVEAFLHRKYMPLFAIASIPLLVGVVFPALLKPLKFTLPKAKENLSALTGVFLIIFSFFISRSKPAVELFRADLFFSAERLVQTEPFPEDDRIVVLSDFPATAWLQLYFYLLKEPGQKTSRYRVAIDGRSLVNGEARINDYMKLALAEEGWESVIDDWGVELIVLPRKGAAETKHWRGLLVGPKWRNIDLGKRWEGFALNTEPLSKNPLIQAP